MDRVVFFSRDQLGIDIKQKKGVKLLIKQDACNSETLISQFRLTYGLLIKYATAIQQIDHIKLLKYIKIKHKLLHNMPIIGI